MINGVAVQTDEVHLFPGSYLLTSGNEYANYGNGALVVKHPNDYPNAYDLRPELTKAGADAFLDAAKAKLAACVKEQKLRPAGCAFFNLREREGQDIDEKTIKRTIDKDPWNNAEPKLDYSGPGDRRGERHRRLVGHREGPRGRPRRDVHRGRLRLRDRTGQDHRGSPQAGRSAS